MVIIIKYLYCSFRCLIMMRISMSLPKKLMEVIVVNGDVTQIRDLTERMMRLKGVEHVKLTSTANGESLDHEHSHEHDIDHVH